MAVRQRGAERGRFTLFFVFVFLLTFLRAFAFLHTSAFLFTFVFLLISASRACRGLKLTVGGF
eukprot:m.203383 g.203383  ORF g.203383 m.203383 type:complete len:63 (+) comp39621_c2_seq25:671-859(+)